MRSAMPAITAERPLSSGCLRPARLHSLQSSVVGDPGDLQSAYRSDRAFVSGRSLPRCDGKQGRRSQPRPGLRSGSENRSLKSWNLLLPLAWLRTSSSPKIASDWRQAERPSLSFNHTRCRSFLLPLPVGKIPGVGPRHRRAHEGRWNSDRGPSICDGSRDAGRSLRWLWASPLRARTWDRPCSCCRETGRANRFQQRIPLNVTCRWPR